MSIGRALGTTRFRIAVGQGYVDTLRSGASASAILASAAKYLGLESTQAISLGGAVFLGWPLLAYAFGYAAERWRLIHAEQEKSRDVNPAATETLALLRQIAENTTRPPCACTQTRDE